MATMKQGCIVVLLLATTPVPGEAPAPPAACGEWDHPARCGCNGSSTKITFPAGRPYDNWHPPIHRNLHYNNIWAEAVMAGVRAAVDVVGAVEPVSFFFLDKQTDPSAYTAVGEAICEAMDEPLGGDGALCESAQFYVDEATNDQGDAFNTDRAGYSVRGDECDEGDFDEFLDEPIVMFINFIGNSERSDLAYFATRGTHEYTHVFQSVHVPAMRPAWLVEGSAEYNAYRNGGNATSAPFPYQEHGYNLTFESQMIDFSLNLRIRPMLRAAPSMKMEMMENMDEDYHSAASDEYIRELAYDMGAWAVAYIIHLSGKDQMAFWRGPDFWPRMKAVGWEKVVTDYTHLSSMSEFYAHFDEFIRQGDTAAMAAILDDRAGAPTPQPSTPLPPGSDEVWTGGAGGFVLMIVLALGLFGLASAVLIRWKQRQQQPGGEGSSSSDGVFDDLSTSLMIDGSE